MATIDNEWGKGVIYTAGIDLSAQKPLDSRISVQTRSERDAHATMNRAYEGMKVYVVDDSTTYTYKNGNWVVDLDADAIVNDLTTGGTGKVLSAEQGKILKQSIDNISAGELSVPIATTKKVGGIKSGSAENVGEVVVAIDGKATVSKVAVAQKLESPRTFTLDGDVSGSAAFDGSGNVIITTTVADNSHNHTIENISDLQTALDSKADKSDTYTKDDVDTLISNLNAEKILNKGVIEATTADITIPEGGASAAPVQAKLNAYISENYSAERPHGPEHLDALIVTVTDSKPVANDKIKYTYSTYSKLWMDTGRMDAEVATATSATAGIAKLYNEVGANEDGAITQKAASVAINAVQSGLTSHTSNTSNPHNVTKAQVGLDQVENLAPANLPISTATQSALDLKAPLDSPAFTGTATIGGKTIATEEYVTTSISNIPNPDWSEEDTGSAAYIANKPTTLPNPNGLTLKVGSKLEVTYDGSETKSFTVTLDDLNGIPLVANSTEGHVAFIGASGAVKDGGFTLPVPSDGDENVGKFLKVTGTTEYGLTNIAINDVTNLQTTLDSKANTTVVDALKIFSKITTPSGEVTPTGNNDSSLTFANGNNVTITASGSTITINAVDTTYEPATASEEGLMSAEDKSKLDAFKTADNYYEKTEVYTKTESDANYYKKAETYTQEEVNAKIAAVDDKFANYWSKTELVAATTEQIQAIFATV